MKKIDKFDSTQSKAQTVPGDMTVEEFVKALADAAIASAVKGREITGH